MSLDDILIEMKNLKGDLAAIKDAEAIRSVKYRYCWETDGGWDEKGPAHTGRAADLFSADATWDARPLGPLAVGREAIRETFRGIQPAISFAMHNVLNGEIEVSGDTAVGRWNALIFMTTATGESALSSCTYDDTFVRTPVGWMIQSVKFTMVRQFGLSSGY